MAEQMASKENQMTQKILLASKGEVIAYCRQGNGSEEGRSF